jgi:coproporphyrinogen III oxidase
MPPLPSMRDSTPSDSPSLDFVPRSERDWMIDWLLELRQQIVSSFEKLEEDYAEARGGIPGRFTITPWEREAGGGGHMGLMRGQVFEKVGCNVSVVHGELAPALRAQLPGTEEHGFFWAAGISLVSHMRSPWVPTVHMNTRMIVTGQRWFGGGADLTPCFPFDEDTRWFHRQWKECCDRHDPDYYLRFKEECDRYFYLPHRQEPRGIGGIFYDYLQSGDPEKDRAFTQDVGASFLPSYVPIVERRMFEDWEASHKHEQKLKRARYVEFNLLHDRGTKFGFLSGGNPEAILMSMPPEAAWP